MIRKNNSQKRYNHTVQRKSHPRVVRPPEKNELREVTIEEMRKFKDYESFINSPAVERLAYGFETGSVLELPTEQLLLDKIPDMENLRALSVPIEDTPPVPVTYLGGQFVLRDGHERYLTARQQNKPIRAIVTIEDDPIERLESLLKTNLRVLYKIQQDKR